VIDAYEQLARLIHGEPVSLEGVDDEGEGNDMLDAEGASNEETSDEDEGASQAAITVAERNGEEHLPPSVRSDAIG
jgi:hypothetical protein